MNKVFYIVDDDPIFRKMVSIMIKKNNPNAICRHCKNGAIGLKSIEAEIKGSNDNDIIVLLDLNMPVLNGWGFLNEIESNSLYSIPNLSLHIVSSSTDLTDILKAKQHDIVSNFFHKPLSDNDIKLISKNI